MSAAASVDPVEVERFSRMAAEWWDPKGKFKPLHKFNPVRLAILKRELCHRFGRDMRAMNALAGLTILDIGCGGGLVAEPLARLGATVTGIDPSPVNVDVARLHAADTGTAVDYRATTAEDLAMEGARFDAVLALEVVEHVDGVPAFLATVASLVKPGGLVAVATINRTPKAYALAIVGAERVLRWLPPGTHSYDKLVTPDEVETPLKAAGLDLASRTGVVYDPLRALWKESRDTDVNYMVFAGKAG